MSTEDLIDWTQKARVYQRERDELAKALRAVLDAVADENDREAGDLEDELEAALTVGNAINDAEAVLKCIGGG